MRSWERLVTISRDRKEFQRAGEETRNWKWGRNLLCGRLALTGRARREGRQVLLLEGKEVALFPEGEGRKRWETLQKKAATSHQPNPGPGVIPLHRVSGLSLAVCCHQRGLSKQDTERMRVFPSGACAHSLVCL